MTDPETKAWCRRKARQIIRDAEAEWLTNSVDMRDQVIQRHIAQCLEKLVNHAKQTDRGLLEALGAMGRRQA